jgi:NAD(P)-dependent dehydrogenase (short-subunit alcohol dehydrogenase family)
VWSDNQEETDVSSNDQGDGSTGERALTERERESGPSVGRPLEGRVAVVVGTSPNIGAGIAIQLSRAGAAVACVDQRQDNALDCAASIDALGERSIAIHCDVTDEEAVVAAVARVNNELGTSQVLVNGVTLYNEQGVLSMPLAQWRRQIDTILTGAFLMTKHVAGELVRLGLEGSIINIASTTAYQGEPNNVGYSTAKAGLLNFTRSVAMELASHRIRVNSLTPTATDPAESFLREREWHRPERTAPDEQELRAFFDDVASRVPLQELPLPSDYGDAAVFLACDSSRMITGIDLRVDAGSVAKYWRWDPGRDQRPPGSNR